MKYVKGFDTIRALAVLIVIVGHWGLPFAPNAVLAGIIDSVVQFGRFGVIIFFVLSGFLITSILLNEKVKHPDEKHFVSIKNFFARRILRIFPIYYLFLLIIYICNDTFVRSHIWYYIGYSSNLLRDIDKKSLPHFWTLAVEEQFYLVWPWFILLINRKYVKYVFIVFILMGIASQYLSNNILHLPYGFLSINCFDSFGIGAIYAYIRLDSAQCKQFEQSFKTAFPILLFIAWKMVPAEGTPIGVLCIRLLDNIIALAMIIFAINSKTIWVKQMILENKVLNFIGKISYGIYVYHFTFRIAFTSLNNYFMVKLPAIRSILNNDYVFYFTKLGALILVSWLSYKFIEQPIMRLKKKFEYPKK